MSPVRRVAILLAVSCGLASGTVHADAYTDEANRQSQMASMRAQDAANDRAAADRSFAAGLDAQRSAISSGGYSGGGGYSSGGSGTALDGLAGALAARRERQRNEPQAVVARKTLIIRVQETPAQVVSRLTAEATGGNMESAFDLARVLYSGYGGVSRDDAAARKWFAAAADAGNAAAQAQLGYMAHEGLGGPVDKALALASTAKAAAQGDAYGAGLNGFYQIEAAPDAMNPAAVAALTKAADADHLFAQVALGTIVYELGVGAPQDDAKAAHYSRLAAEGGHPLAQMQYGRMLAVGRGVAKDAAAGAAMARKSAEAGLPEGMRLYGQLVGMGEGVPKDEAGGLAWLRKAADAGDPMAAGIVGYALLSGGNDADIPQGIAYIRAGAAKGDLQSKAVLGTLMVKGLMGVTEDRRTGARLLREAAEGGNVDAKDTLADPSIKALIAGL